MLTKSTHRAPEDILGALEYTPNPMFLLSVGPRLDIRFAGLNAAYARMTGLTRDTIIGKRPDQVLPARIADTALANYRECCARGVKLTFQEVLDLPGGRGWWLTTLVPISDAGGIHTLVGTSVDVGALKKETEKIFTKCQNLRARADHWHVVATDAAEDTRGPMNNILSLSRMLKSGNETAEGVVTIASLMEDTAALSLRRLDHKINAPLPAIGDRLESANFKHLGQEFAAFVDPDGALDITYPECSIEAEGAMLRLLVHALADQAGAHAATFVRINIAPSPIDPCTQRLIFEFDTLPHSRVNLTRLNAMCRVHGVKIRHIIHHAVHRIEFLLPTTNNAVRRIVAQGSGQLRSSA